MIDWVPFFRTITIASGSERDSPLFPYLIAAHTVDATANRAAARFRMIPLPGGRGDLGRSELADLFIQEGAQ